MYVATELKVCTRTSVTPVARRLKPARRCGIRFVVLTITSHGVIHNATRSGVIKTRDVFANNPPQVSSVCGPTHELLQSRPAQGGQSLTLGVPAARYVGNCHHFKEIKYKKY